MVAVENLNGKTLDEASEIVREQIKHIIGEVDIFQNENANAFSSPQELKEFLQRVSKIRNNVRLFMETANERLCVVERNVQLKMIKTGQCV